MSNQQIVPLDYITVKVENWDDIPKAVNCSNEIKRIVESNNLGFLKSISDDILRLANYGDLLQFTYAASRGFPYCESILLILYNYQSFLNDFVSKTSQFVYFSISALAQHSLALLVAEKHPLKAVKFLRKSSDKAQEIVDKYLIDLKHSDTDFENIFKLSPYDEEFLKVLPLEIIIRTMRVRTIFKRTKLFFHQVKIECKKLVDISTLEELSQLSDIDKDFQTDYMNQIKKSGLNWLSLSKINYDAANTIVGVKKNFDTVMSNLPGKEEALKIVNECTTAMEKLLIEDNNKIAKMIIEIINIFK